MTRELKSWSFWRAVLAEFVGMTVFVFIGIASAIGNKHNRYPDQEVKVALAFGLAIATLAQSLGHISGAHLNPAVTLGLLVSCQISFFRAFMYIVAQMLGAVLASGIMFKVSPDPESTLGLNMVSCFKCYIKSQPRIVHSELYYVDSCRTGNMLRATISYIIVHFI